MQIRKTEIITPYAKVPSPKRVGGGFIPQKIFKLKF